jgi:putative ABC transport system ATP-binding protein
MNEKLTTSTMIQLEDLLFRYGEGGFQMRIASLSIGAGEHVAVVGASGCGKTTFAYLLAGIHVPAGGSVSIDGTVISTLSDAARRDFRISNIGFIFQEFELVEYLRVEENILLPYLVNDSLALGSDTRDRARELAGSVGLGDKLRRRPGELSQGEKQRLAICRALITNPGIILADEPTGNLDAGNADSILRLILRQARERGATFIMITHNQGLIDSFDRVVDLEDTVS